MSQEASERVPERRSSGRKLWLLGAIVAAAGIGFYLFRERLSLETLATQEAQLREFQLGNPWLVYALAFAVYMIVTGASLPFATALTLTYGWLLGFLPALVLVSFASTAGSTIAFLLSRYLVRDGIQARFGDRLERFDAALKREGPYYLFTLRLIPAVPFFVINVVMGLTAIPTRTFWWVSQLGMLPGTVLFVYTGSEIPTLGELAENGASGIFTPQLIAAFVLLGTFPLAARWAIKLYKKQESPT